MLWFSFWAVKHVFYEIFTKNLAVGKNGKFDRNLAVFLGRLAKLLSIVGPTAKQAAVLHLAMR